MSLVALSRRQAIDPASLCPNLERAMSQALEGQALPAEALCSIIATREDAEFEERIAYRSVRSWYISRYGFAVPCAEAVSAIAAHGPVLEVGAGTGFWAKLVAHQADVVATDIATGQNAWGMPVSAWYPVEQADAAEAVRAHPGRTVLMVWPSLNEPWAYEAAKAMQVGTVLCYVGEGHSGCTADDDFHDYLGSAFQPLSDVTIPQFCFINDYLWIGRKVTD